MIRLDAATVLLQWAVGGMLFCWVTTRHRLVSLGYGWLLRAIFGVLAAAAVAVAFVVKVVPAREAASIGVGVAAFAALGVSVVRRGAGVSRQREEQARRHARVAAMTAASGSSAAGPAAPVDPRPEFPPWLDLVPVCIGAAGLVVAAWAAGGNHLVAILRTLIGAAFLGCVTDAMLLGHWYLTQPGLSRAPIHELNSWLMRLWPFEVGVLLLPTGMVSVLAGTVDDGWNGVLGWMWVACALSTIVLSVVTRAALRERSYSAVMAATGLLYLAILTGFGTDLVARAILG